MSGADELGVRVDPQALARHAGLMEMVAGGVEQARDAGNSVLLGAGAYGILCAFLPKLLEPAQRQTTDTLAAVATGLRAVAGTVREGSLTYQQLDEQSAAAYRRATAR